MIRKSELYLSIETTAKGIYNDKALLNLIHSMVGQLPVDQMVHVTVEAIKEIPEHD